MSQIPRLNLIRSLANATSGSMNTQLIQNQQTIHMTNSVLVHSDIVGNTIHNDARRLVESLTKEDDRDNPLVHAIVGLRGIGKTTLAKLVFEDHMIKSHFELNVWVSVSKIYDEFDILRSIITCADGDNGHHSSLYYLAQKAVEGKRLFMVLDDMWETKRVWKDLLRSLLKSGAAKGSRVLVTTRNKEVADQMMALHSHQVEPLPLGDGWTLLCKSAFPAWEQQNAKDDVWNLKDIGIELFIKCNGLPLAINVIGGMLSAKSRTKEAWELVLKSSVWEVNGLPEEIHSALYISYQYLPTNIKQCFLYCSWFPKDKYFNIVNAKNLWIQKVLIKDETNLSLQYVAERYLKILVQRNLLLLDRKYIDAVDFKMHDLVRSLSQFLAQNENFVATEGKEFLNSALRGRTMKLRRLSFIGGTNKMTNHQTKCLQEHGSLRTLLIFDKPIYTIDNGLFNHLRHLRILWLRGTNVTELPVSVGSLTLLRYLNISQTPMRKLPKAIKNLKTLRILDVSECVYLYNLPSCIMNFHHLYSLITKGSALDHLPLGLGKLNKLLFLEFTLPLEDIEQESSTIKELGTLTELRQLKLYKLERVFDRSQVESAALKDEQHLERLELSCSERDSNEVSEEVTNKIEEVFEGLCPPLHLKVLKISNYFGSKLPSWLGSPPTCMNVRHLILSHCSKCKKLEGLGSLPNLESLHIEDASSIKIIGPEFYTNNDVNNIEHSASQNSIFFPKMKLLFFENMDNWEEWSSLGKTISVMPHLEILQIYECPKFKSFPEEILRNATTSLRRIRICKATQLFLKEVHDLPCLQIIDIGNVPYLERISGLPALQTLMIEDCPGINLVELTPTLQNIYWKDFNADSLPNWFSTDGYEADDNIKLATYLRISCKEELVMKIRSEEEIGSVFLHFDNIAVWNEDKCLRLTYPEMPQHWTSQDKSGDFSSLADEEEKRVIHGALCAL